MVLVGVCANNTIQIFYTDLDRSVLLTLLSLNEMVLLRTKTYVMTNG